MCLAPSAGQYIAYLPEEDFLDTFALNVGPGGLYNITLQNNSNAGYGGQGYLTSYATLDSLYIPLMRTPASKGGWPDTLNGKTFIFDFHAALHHDSRDTLFAKLRWIGIGSGTDLRPPLEFKMFLVKNE